jgi:phosphoglycerate dehydrogenase-like enzyme
MSSKRVKVFFPIDVPAELDAHLRAQMARIPEVEAVFPASLDEGELLRHAPEAEVVVTWRVPPAVFDALTSIKLWLFPGVGVQHLIKPFRELNEKRKVILCNTHGNTYATAQHSVAMLLALMSRVVRYHNWMVDGRWRIADEEGGPSLTLRGYTIGLLGYGAINAKAHRFLAGFDCSFAVCRRHWDRQSEELPTDVQRFTDGQLDEFLRAVDILLIAVPQTSKTAGLIGARELQLLGKRGIVVNVSRGSVIDEAALYSALKERTIEGAAVDVWYDYRPEPDAQGRKYPYAAEHPFHGLDNVVLSPHRAASPIYDLRRWEDVIDVVRRYARGEQLVNVVNLDDEY